MSDNYRFRDVRSGQGPVNIGQGNRAAGRDYVDNRGGHYAGRDLYHDQRAYREGDYFDVQAGQADPFDAMASGKGIGRLLAGIGTLLALAGFGVWMYLIVTGMTDASQGTTPASPFAKKIGDTDISLAGAALAAAVIGGVLAAIGAAMAKAARRRHDRRMRNRRRRYPD